MTDCDESKCHGRAIKSCVHCGHLYCKRHANAMYHDCKTTRISAMRRFLCGHKMDRELRQNLINLIDCNEEDDAKSIGSILSTDDNFCDVMEEMDAIQKTEDKIKDHEEKMKKIKKKPVKKKAKRKVAPKSKKLKRSKPTIAR